MDQVVNRENLIRALKRVRANKGSPGVDGMSIDDLTGYLREHWQPIRERLLRGDNCPQLVKEVLIPKPGAGPDGSAYLRYWIDLSSRRFYRYSIPYLTLPFRLTAMVFVLIVVLIRR